MKFPLTHTQPAAETKTGETPEALVRAETIGNLLALTERSVYNHYNSGKIPGYRIGKAIRFRVSEVFASLKKS